MFLKYANNTITYPYNTYSDYPNTSLEITQNFEATRGRFGI